MTDKRKNEHRIGRMTFLVAWIVIGISITFISQSLFNLIWSPSDSFSSSLFNISLVAISCFAYSLGGYFQSIAIYRLRGIKLRHWWWLSGIGISIGLVFSHTIAVLYVPLIIELPHAPHIAGSLGATISLGVLGILQAWVLRPYFRHVYVYVLVLLTSPLIYLLLSFAIPMLPNLSNIVTDASIGLTLLWLDHITYEQVDDKFDAEATT